MSFLGRATEQLARNGWRSLRIGPIGAGELPFIGCEIDIIINN